MSKRLAEMQLHTAWWGGTCHSRSMAPSHPMRQEGTGTHPHTGLGCPPCSLFHLPIPSVTWTMLTTKKGSQVTKNKPSRTPSVRLAFSAFLLCLVARRRLSADSTPVRGVLGTCGRKSHVIQLSRGRLGPQPHTVPQPRPSPSTAESTEPSLLTEPQLESWTQAWP